MDVGVDRKARCRQQARERDDGVALKPERVGEDKPARDAAVILGLAIMIDKPASPLAPQRRILSKGNAIRGSRQKPKRVSKWSVNTQHILF
jgi:hypothetical protein